LAKRRYRQWRKALLKDKVAQVITQAKADLPTKAQARKSGQEANCLTLNATTPRCSIRHFDRLAISLARRGGAWLQDGGWTASQASGHALERKGASHLLAGALRAAERRLRLLETLQ